MSLLPNVRWFATALIAGGLATACSEDELAGSPTPTPDAGTADSAPQPVLKDIVDTAVAAGSFKTLVGAVQGAGLEATLRSPGPFTVFAPTDDAFAKLPPFLVAKLVTPAYKTELGLILKYHVLSGAVKAADVLGKTQSVAAVAGGNLSVDGSNNKVVLNGGVNVSTADVAASNGIIHIVDGVLLPNIVGTASSYDDGTVKFSTLVTAITAADLGTTLSGPGPFTVFAPTDAAFAALKTEVGDATFNAILADKAKLGAILKYHVVAGSVYAKDVTTGDVATVNTAKIKLTVTGSDVTIGDSTAKAAKVILSDIPNSNGVIHVIDKVLLPPAG